jgi:hypothetical protein
MDVLDSSALNFDAAVPLSHRHATVSFVSDAVDPLLWNAQSSAAGGEAVSN